MPATTLPVALPNKSLKASPSIPPPPGCTLPPPPPRGAAGCKLPPAAPPPRTPFGGGGPAKSHQTGTIEHHWNDLPTSFLPTSRSTSPLPPRTGESGDTAQVLAEHFDALVARLFAADTPGALQEREKKAALERVRRTAVTDAQKRELAEVLDAVLEGREKPEWGREQVVRFITRNPGVAGWAIGIRRGVEGVKL
ncbi:hypothetical protein FN846DRAFT_975359 [Sphaerosporella brunnea]|uniref:Uncharacterized protein n=1 Tax=Sphaerosporella brunnea TaxID=1250544 RepID=A0A5J5EGY9_9PEZI|nr:hypothetical protein FN846DRAFT_975359 [Sphaerosporella brunnea]